LFNFLFSALTLDTQSLLTEHGLNGSEVKGVVMIVLMVRAIQATVLVLSVLASASGPAAWQS
jgi:hypothetical protein